MKAPTQEEESLARMALITYIRDTMRDFPELNTLIDGVENDDRTINNAITWWLQYFTETPPFVGNYRYVANFPFRANLVDAVIARLLQSAVILLARNEIDFSSGSVQVRSPQVSLYSSIGDSRMSMALADARRLKVSTNMQQAIEAAGGVFSDYDSINTFSAQSLNTTI